jgi:hypothetical protein
MATFEQRVAEQFVRDIADHVMTVKHENGLYRHLVCSRPTTSAYRFELITWPGYLAIVGDMGAYTFARLEDMFQFFRTSAGGINPAYWSEKVQGDTATDGYSEEKFRAIVTEVAEAAAEEWPGLTEAVKAEILDSGALYHRDGAYEVVNGFVHEVGKRRFEFTDTWEWNASDWTFRFLWCCHAIVWGIAAYDRQRAERAEPCCCGKPGCDGGLAERLAADGIDPAEITRHSGTIALGGDPR